MANLITIRLVVHFKDIPFIISAADYNTFAHNYISLQRRNICTALKLYLNNCIINISTLKMCLVEHFKSLIFLGLI